MRFLFFIALILLQWTYVEAQNFAVGDTVYVISSTNLRPEPTFSSSSDTVAVVTEGTKKVVKQVSDNGDYVKVESEQKNGWLYFSYISDWNSVKKAQEKERRLAEEKQEYLDYLRNSGYGVKLLNMRLSTNSANGITPSVGIVNIDQERTIKYITFTFTPYNPVGDATYGNITNKSTQDARGVGPISPGEEAYYSFENLWYSRTTDCIEINKIKVEYMNGSSFVYINDLKDIRKEAKSINLTGECRNF